MRLELQEDKVLLSVNAATRLSLSVLDVTRPGAALITTLSATNWVSAGFS